MRKLIASFGLILSIGLAAQENVYDLIVKVQNIQSEDGKVRIGLFDSKENFLKKRLSGLHKIAFGESVEVTFKGLKDGFYAISVFHDENDNSELDANFIGIPNEPYAFSNNAMGMFGPPNFDDCMFEIKGETKEITIHL